MAGKIPDHIIDEVSRKTDILDVVGQYVNLSRKGDRWWGLCPFHNERSPSFSVIPDSNLYYCFGCQKGGGIYQFLMEMESLSFPESVHRLAEKAGIVIESDPSGELQNDNRKALEELYRKVSAMYQWLLENRPEAEHARRYLSERGISGETARLYGLGWAPDDGEWLYGFLSRKNYTPQFLAKSGLFSKKSPRWSYFVDRLMFPVMPEADRIVAFSGRTLSDRGPKYINSPETVLYKKSRNLYGWSAAKKDARKARRVILCEGNMDVLSCSQSGIPEAAAPLGTAFTEEQAKLVRRYADTLLLMFDGDSAGCAATMKAAILAERAGLTVQALPMPSGQDPSDILNTQGPDSLKKIVHTPINIFKYLLDFFVSADSDLSGEAQEEALNNLTPYLESVGSEVRREAYLRELAEIIHADPSTVIREFRNRKGRAFRRMQRVERVKTQSSQPVVEPVGDELYLMTAVAVKTEHFFALRSMLAPESLRDRRALSVYRVLDELSLEGEIPGTDAVVSRLDDESLKAYIIQKAASEVYDEKARETIREKVRGLLLRSLVEERQELLEGLFRNDPEAAGLKEARMLRIQEIGREILNIRQGEDVGSQV